MSARTEWDCVLDCLDRARNDFLATVEEFTLMNDLQALKMFLQDFDVHVLVVGNEDFVRWYLEETGLSIHPALWQLRVLTFLLGRDALLREAFTWK